MRKEAALSHESLNCFIENACSKNKVLHCYAFVNAVHPLLQQIVRFIRAHWLKTVAYAACLSEEA